MNENIDSLTKFISEHFPKMGGWCDFEKGIEIGKIVFESKPQRIAEVGVF